MLRLLLLTFLVRVLNPEQPIVENYVGRQMPTAMVARNLDRGSGFMRPQLDTAPFPNYFLVEPPIYEIWCVRLEAGDRPEPGRGGPNFSADVLGGGGAGACSCWRGGARARAPALVAL